MFKLLITILPFLFLHWPLSARVFPGDEWPQWRGPKRDGISQDTNLLKKWPGDGPKLLWRIPLGTGYSCVAVAGNKAYTMFDDGDDEFAICVDAKSGQERWRFRTDKRYYNAQGGGSRVTPLIDGNLAYFIGGHARMYALDKESGTVVWQRDIITEFGGTLREFGYTSNPVILGELLVVEGCGAANRSFIAFEKNSGDLVWSSQTEPPGYSSPIVVEIDGVRQVIFFAGTRIAALSPKNGDLLWSYPWPSDFNENVATPLYLSANTIFFSSGHPKGKGAAVLRIDTYGNDFMVKTLWKSNVMQNHFSTAIFYNGFIFGMDQTILKCIKASNGEELWRKSGFGEGALILADGKLIVLGSRGRLALVHATPEGYREISSARVLRGRSLTPPALAYGKLYLRNEREMICLDLKK